jgi:ParB family chromosome partitioning protein
VMEIALIENLQREDLNAMEVAVAYQGLIDSFSLTQEELSVKVGKSRSHIANFLRLLQLPEEVKQLVSRGTLSMGHARAIVGLKDVSMIKDVAKQTIKNEWSVRELEEYIQKLEQPAKPNKKVNTVKGNPYIRQLEESLRETFRTKVVIKHNKDKGKIELLYYSNDDLERLLELLQAKTE